MSSLVSLIPTNRKFSLLINSYIYLYVYDSFDGENMAKTIAVSDEVYELLMKSKLPDESFSETIRRALKKGMKLSDIAGSGTVTREEWVKVAKVFEKQKKLDNERTRRLMGKA